jgi:hypothetical protein
MQPNSFLIDPPLADAVLAVHLLIIMFNVAGLVVIPAGALAGWQFVRDVWLRLLHLGLLAIVAVQALMGRACILTIWQNRLNGANGGMPPLIMHWIDGIIYWNLPLWVFSILYVMVFTYVVLLWFIVPPRRRVVLAKTMNLS